MFRHPGALKLGVATRGHGVPDVQPQDWRVAAAHDAQTRARAAETAMAATACGRTRAPGARRWRGGDGYGIVSR